MLSLPCVEFKDKFEKDMLTYMEHDFVNKKQKEYIYKLKTEKLKTQKALLITVDFAENFTTVLQDAVYVRT